MKNTKRIGIILVCLLMLTNTAWAKSQAVVSIGQDLNQAQRQEMIQLFGADSSDIMIEVSNQEERKYLGDFVDSSVLGTRAISSSYVEPLKKGKGIVVETHNISWVTPDMLISSLATAGVRDARVIVAAPFKVSGTAALTGVIKGFEESTGEKISEEGKLVASEEIATTGGLAEEIGSEEASQIINAVKEQVVELKLDDPQEIKKIIEEASKDINISLTEEQKEQISRLMEKISNLDLNVEDIKGQLKNISDKLRDLNETTEEVKTVVEKILVWVKNIFSRLADVFGG